MKRLENLPFKKLETLTHQYLKANIGLCEGSSHSSGIKKTQYLEDPLFKECFMPPQPLFVILFTELDEGRYHIREKGRRLKT